MKLTTLCAISLLVLASALAITPTASAREAPDVPPVCGEFYNWCDNLVDDTRDTARHRLCTQVDLPCPL